MDRSELRDHLLDYVAKHAHGHEGEIGSTFAKGHLEPSLALLKVLTKLGTPAAREAAQEATRSPHPIVRIEALGLVEGASGVGIRQALRAMLEDWDPGVRLAALQSIGTYRVKVAGPGLVMRVKSPEFDGLPSDERREALRTLFMLTSARAETLCLELLGDTRLVAADPHEQTRAIAAEMIGAHGRTTEALAAIEAASRGRWKNSERVRTAAANAVKAWGERGKQDSEPPPSSSVNPGADAAIWRGGSAPPPGASKP
jgi:HEAT repeat protein